MNPRTLPLGPVMLDVLGHQLTDADRARLVHPLTGGVILFQRNYASPPQIAELCAAIRALRTPELLIAVDHEGGRVQRFREGYTPIPAMAELGALWDVDRTAARRRAEAVGLVIATELIASGVDFSFTPVLDLDFGRSQVIGTRAFHSDAAVVGELGSALIAGLARGGAAAVGKHFPGHGFAGADSHVEVPVDPRTLAEIRAADLAPYRRLVRELGGVMPAHVLYPEADKVPAGFSRIWLQDVLRGEIGFEGLIFSDDMSMEAASVAGGIVARAEAAISAGCDMVLVCNRPDRADELLDGLNWRADTTTRHERLALMRSNRRYASLAAAQTSAAYQAALTELHADAPAASALRTARRADS
jgi:beta-N-acetylhexosaminidase